MNDFNQTIRVQETVLENLAAELAAAAYLVALRHGVGGSWVDLQLDLWQVLADTVRNWEQELPSCQEPGDAAWTAPAR